jgi:ATP-binding cassette subfamily B multidrug efflux pump
MESDSTPKVDDVSLENRGGLFAPLLGWFERRVEPFPEEAPSRPPDTLLPFLWHYARPVWPWLLLMSALTVVVSVLEVMLFAFLGNLIDWLGTRDPSAVFSEDGPTMVWMGMVILILLPLSVFVQSTVLHQTVLGNFVMTIRWKAHRWMLGQSYGFYQDEFAGRVATRVMQTSLAARDVIMKVLDVLVYVGVYFVGSLVLVASFSAWMALPFIVWLFAYTLMLRYFMPQLKALSRKQASARSVMTGRVVDSYTNIMTVKLFAHAGHEAGYARDSMDGFLRTVYPQMRLVTLLQSGLSFINGMLLFSVAAAGLWLWSRGMVTVGAIAVGVGLVLRLQGIAHWIMWELSGLFESIGVVYDGMAMLTRTRAVQDTEHAPDLAVPTGAIQFDSVSFDYGRLPRGIATEASQDETLSIDDSHQDDRPAVISDLSLAIRGGEKVGLVGRSGSGKTTLTNLILRLYDVESGWVTVDGQSVAEVSQESLRRHIGVVTQDSSLLHRSVFENIAYGRRDATEADVIAAARRANALDFIQDLEDSDGRRGLDAHVGERGVKLSGGQRQRISIARMFLKDAPILVLDEATSALDSEVEAAIQENLDALMHGKTVIAIAHRLSTIAAMDRLIVMDAGAIVEEGTHAELSAGSGLYAELWARQSGGFLEPAQPAHDVG